MNFYFKCNNPKETPIICNIDSHKIKCKKRNDVIESVIKLDEGHHTLVVKKRTFLDTPLYYLNFFILNSMFNQGERIGHLGYDENFAAIKISFDVVDEQDGNIEVTIKWIENYEPLGYFYEIYCDRTSGLKNVCIEKLNMDTKRIRRFKLTRILSIVFYTALLILCIIDGVNRENIIWSIIFCVFYISFIPKEIHNILKLGRVKDKLNKSG